MTITDEQLAKYGIRLEAARLTRRDPFFEYDELRALMADLREARELLVLARDEFRSFMPNTAGDVLTKIEAAPK